MTSHGSEARRFSDVDRDPKSLRDAVKRSFDEAKLDGRHLGRDFPRTLPGEVSKSFYAHHCLDSRQEYFTRDIGLSKQQNHQRFTFAGSYTSKPEMELRHGLKHKERKIRQVVHGVKRVFPRRSTSEQQYLEPVGFTSSFDEVECWFRKYEEKEAPFLGVYRRNTESESIIARFKRNLSTFDGTWHTEDLISWVDDIEDFFEEVKPPLHLKCGIVLYKMEGAAYDWWNKLQRERIICGKEEIASWPRMKKLLFNRFLPTECLVEFHNQQSQQENTKHSTCSIKCPIEVHNHKRDELNCSMPDTKIPANENHVNPIGETMSYISSGTHNLQQQSVGSSGKGYTSTVVQLDALKKELQSVQYSFGASDGTKVECISSKQHVKPWGSVSEFEAAHAEEPITQDTIHETQGIEEKAEDLKGAVGLVDGCEKNDEQILDEEKDSDNGRSKENEEESIKVPLSASQFPISETWIRENPPTKVLRDVVPSKHNDISSQLLAIVDLVDSQQEYGIGMQQSNAQYIYKNVFPRYCYLINGRLATCEDHYEVKKVEFLAGPIMGTNLIVDYNTTCSITDLASIIFDPGGIFYPARTRNNKLEVECSLTTEEAQPIWVSVIDIRNQNRPNKTSITKKVLEEFTFWLRLRRRILVSTISSHSLVLASVLIVTMGVFSEATVKVVSVLIFYTSIRFSDGVFSQLPWIQAIAPRVMNLLTDPSMDGEDVKATARLFMDIGDEALQIFRLKDETSVSLVAFEVQHVVVSNFRGLADIEQVRLNMRSLRALINWLHILQDQGLEMFDSSIATILNRVGVTRSGSVIEFRPCPSEDAHSLNGCIVVNMDNELFELPLSPSYPCYVICMGNNKCTEEGISNDTKDWNFDYHNTLSLLCSQSSGATKDITEVFLPWVHLQNQHVVKEYQMVIFIINLQYFKYGQTFQLSKVAASIYDIILGEVYGGHYCPNQTWGQVILWEAWNDEYHSNREWRSIMTILSVSTIYPWLSILWDNGHFRKTLKLFHKMVNGLDPPIELNGVLGRPQRGFLRVRSWTSFF